jgi:hypothetical protein
MAPLLDVLQDCTAGRQYVGRTLSEIYKRYHGFRESSCKLLMTAYQLENIDGSLCCHSRWAAHTLNSRPQAKFPTCLRFLSSEHIPGSQQSERISNLHLISFGHTAFHHTACALTASICYLGELTLVLELAY